ncbi:peroxiredoxin Q/BCP [Sphingomonas sp. BE270]|uniref:peroxiredoxin n=1 Tax=unclassified Sphingomonas TaxID=196159 RepID=UPI00053F135D|nr:MULTISPECIES: peroxiredoxin [unclassified Sphingomonas]MDR6847394.1 peroxiredoxin Q/BCP [Sphingomonas sp. BE137]MDR7256938.1 peroxiredoxin Q/BCP [Sphingomonas sp. BE270]
MTIIEEGGALPAIDLATPTGERLNLRDYVGKIFVLYFYPKDDTSGCTREAQDFSSHYAEFQALGAAVLGVSRDTPAKHQKFIDKYDLTVPLATDDSDAAMQAFGVWVEKKLYGKTYMGIDRSTFLFDAAGILVRDWRKVKVPGHVVDVLEAVRALG